MGRIEEMYRRYGGDGRFRRRVLAYVDVLGWKELTGRPTGIRAPTKIFAVTESFRRSLLADSVRADFNRRHDAKVAKTLRTSIFSDTVLFSCEPAPDDVAWLLDSVQHLCMNLLEIGCYTRGAVTVGDLLHDARGSGAREDVVGSPAGSVGRKKRRRRRRCAPRSAGSPVR